MSEMLVNRQIVLKAVSEIKDYESAHKIGNTIPALKESIKQYGINQPISVDKNMVIVTGRAVLKAAIELGIEQIPTIVLDDLTDEQIAEYRIADDKTSEFARWNEAKLKKELSYLGDVKNLQFCFKEDLSAMFKPFQAPQPKAASAPSPSVQGGQSTNTPYVPQTPTYDATPSKEESEAFKQELKHIDEGNKAKTKTYFTHICSKCGKAITLNLK